MRKNILAEKLRSGQVVLGLCNMYPAAGIIEGMCPGWDFVWIDGQHGEMAYADCLHAVQVAQGVGLGTLLRVPGHEPAFLGTYADICPSAIMVPMVDTPEQAKAVAQALRFPPLGNRSYGGRRVIDIGGRDYFREQELLVFAQIETLEAVKNLKGILATEGIDGVFFGPDDMKVRMGIPINTPVTDNDQLRRGLEETARAAAEAGKIAAGVAPSAPAIKMMTGMGYRLFACGGDILFLRTMSTQRLAELREAVGAKADGTQIGGMIY